MFVNVPRKKASLLQFCALKRLGEGLHCQAGHQEAERILLERMVTSVVGVKHLAVKCAACLRLSSWVENFLYLPGWSHQVMHQEKQHPNNLALSMVTCVFLFIFTEGKFTVNNMTPAGIGVVVGGGGCVSRRA